MAPKTPSRPLPRGRNNTQLTYKRNSMHGNLITCNGRIVFPRGQFPLSADFSCIRKSKHCNLITLDGKIRISSPEVRRIQFLSVEKMMTPSFRDSIHGIWTCVCCVI